VHVLVRDERPTRALLKITAKYGTYDFHISEIALPSGRRKYAYYVLKDKDVVAGFDNAPDPEALKLKYGTHYSQHRLELVPHLHSAGKAHVSLTDVVDFEQFIAWIEENL